MKESNRKIIILRCLLGILVVSWCVLIYFMSDETAIESSDRSTGLVRRFIDAFVSLFGGDADDAELVDLLEYYVRKAAHMFLFFVLSIFTFSFLSCYSLRVRVRCGITLLFCFLYCVSDEIHQLFVEGRSGNLFDVFVDMVGVISALATMLAFIFIINKIKHKKHRSSPSVI